MDVGAEQLNALQAIFNIVLLVASGAVGFIFRSVFTKLSEMEARTEKRMDGHERANERQIEAIHARISDGSARTNEHAERLARLETNHSAVMNELQEIKGLVRDHTCR